MRTTASRLRVAGFTAALTPFWLSAQTGELPDSVRDLPGVPIDLSIERYELSEPTLAAVVNRLNAMRLEGPGGPPSQGLTRYSIRPEWRVAASGGRCGVSSLTVHTKIDITVPSWPAAPSRPRSEQDAWREIDDAIGSHESAHRDLIIAAARALHAEMRALRATGCRALRQVVSGAIALAEERLDEAHGELDGRTRGGLTIGGGASSPAQGSDGS